MKICICIATKRPPPIKTLRSYGCGDYPIIVIADPEVYQAHLFNSAHMQQYPEQDILVMLGKTGLAPQRAECYRQAAAQGYSHFFRLDDDLPPKTFVHREDFFPSLTDVIYEARQCMASTKTSLVGFANTSRRDWLKEGYSRTYGFIHGCANLSIATDDPSDFIDERIQRCEDVYRTCAHRARDGAVGRVNFIGLDKKELTRETTVVCDEAGLELSKQIILERFGHMVQFIGMETHGVPRMTWRMKR